MKTRIFFRVITPLLLMGILSSCLKDECEREVTYIRSTPVYMTKSEIRLGTATSESARELKNPGQFYYYQDHIFIVEDGEGVHIIDNTIPESPTPISFLAVPGADNMAIKNGILYVNNYIDLMAIDISNPVSAEVIGRTNDIFDPIWEDVNSGQVLVDYILEEVTETMDCHSFSLLRNRGGVFFTEAAFDFVDANTSLSNSSNGAVTGVGGSMARFTIIGDFLYTVSNTSLDVISLEQPTQPNFVSTVDLGWGIETIFPYEDKLFIGSNAGMFIFDNSNPAAPTQLSAFEHARACDPVFVKGNYAYVTLRDGNLCEGFVNQLDLIDISDLSNPELVESFPMDNPHGLTIRNNDLIICEGIHGLKAFDIEDPAILDEKMMDTYEGIHSFDAISIPGSRPLTIVIGEDGFYQFLYSKENGFELLSKIDTKR
ncbi:MAG: hypothetical protein MI974_21200 [Chitinophagales bacterium]|nr:hypothetical protein [Chitinophagales bacterium]